MAIHLMIVGEYDPTNNLREDIDPAALLTQGSQNLTFQMRRCRAVRDFVNTVRKVAFEGAQPIDILDVFDHAGPGQQTLAGDVLFSHLGTGRMIARALRPLLTVDARVRLLGCETAVGPDGRQLLQILREELGGSIVVYGTIERVEADVDKVHEFDERGFKKEREDGFLFSSTEAMQRVAPSHSTRSEELRSWRAALGIPT
ncbi:Hypothetical protein A7982_10291 [Minicystis rosea]|nr:Hypothetical protein A7982_10291 [Minicystis rosea]